MPRVPNYDVPQVEERPLSPVRYDLPRDDSLEQIGGAMENIGAHMEKRAQEMQDEEDAAQLTEAFVAASDRLRPILHEDILQRQGKDSFSAYQDADKAMADIEMEVSNGLRTDRQRNAFRKMWLQQRAGNLSTVSRHVASQKTAYREQQAEAITNSSLEDIAANYAHPDVVAGHMERGIMMIKANLQGQAPEVVKARVDAFVSAAHENVIDRMLVANPGAARAYYNANKKEIDGTRRDDIEKALSTGADTAAAQGVVDKIMNMGLSEADALAFARKNLSGKREDEAVKRLKARYSEIADGERETRDRAGKEANRVMKAGGTPDEFPDWVRDAMSARELESYWNITSAKGKREIGKKSYNRYNELMRMGTSEDPAERSSFAEMTLELEAPNLLPSHQEKISSLQKSLRSQDYKAEERLRVISQARSLAKPRMDKVVAKWGQQSTRAKEMRADFDLKLIERMDEYQAREGHRPTNKDIQDIINDLFMEVSVRDSSWILPDEKKRVFELGDQEIPYVDYDDIPQDFKDGLAEYWVKLFIEGRKFSNSPTEEEVEEAYLKHLLRTAK